MSKPTLAVIEGAEILIRIPFKNLHTLLKAAEDFEEVPHAKIVDVHTYATDVLRALNEEEPNDGTSLIDAMLDKALLEAIEQGSEGVEL